MIKNRPIVVGAGGAVGLLILYFGVLTWTNSFSHAVEQLREMWYWIAVLVLGFGVQLGIYTYIKYNVNVMLKGATAEVAAAGGISTGSMIACCAHHVTDVLPILGLSAAAVFLVKYQVPFILLGIFSNFVGIAIMLNIIQKHRLYRRGGKFADIFSNYNMEKVRNAVAVLSVLIVSLSFVIVSLK